MAAICMAFNLKPDGKKVQQGVIGSQHPKSQQKHRAKPGIELDNTPETIYTERYTK